MPNLIRHPELMTERDVAGERLTIALAGNPNSGKTTIFNALTGSRQHVANYPGVTVEKKEGVCRLCASPVGVVDLPGTYSLTAYSAEELAARNALLEEAADVVIDVLDASNLERNLYLAMQLMELGKPLVLALNMFDVADRCGLEFDLELMSTMLGVPVVPTVGHKGIGTQELIDTAVALAGHSECSRPVRVDYGAELEAEIGRLERLIENVGVSPRGVPARWAAIKLLEKDADLRSRIHDPVLLDSADAAVERLGALLGDDAEALLAERRYGFISDVCRRAIRSTLGPRRTASDRIDAVVTHRVLGIPIFFGLMYAVFHLTFTLGDPPMGWIERGFGWLAGVVGALWGMGDGGLLRSLVVDGVIGGVGGVLVFLPNILLLFLAIALLEDSGYMARAAFLMDRLMHKMGLHGKSFVPMLIGFGCSVPAIMATRTLEHRRDRLATMMVVPLMSCGARLPIYALIIPAFFPPVWHGPMLWIIYCIGIVLAIGCAKLLKSTLLRGETPPFIMELPPYRMPTLRSVGLHMLNRGGAYLRKAGTIILGISIVLWAMQRWPVLSESDRANFAGERAALDARSDLADEVRRDRLAEIGHAETEASLRASLMGRTGRALEPILAPCGFDWRISTAMIGAFAAKEVFVAQMGIVHSLGERADEESVSLRAALQASYTPLQGFCIMLFCLISAPCMATIAMTRRESNSWRWALLQIGGLTVLAWVITAAVYQIGRLVL